MVWSQQEIHTLINIRKTTNQLYWNIFGHLRRTYWNNVANRLNNYCNSNYMGKQCKRKFNNLVIQYNNMELYATNDQKERRSRMFFDELRTRFWEDPFNRPRHDVAKNTATITRRKSDVRARKKRRERRERKRRDGSGSGGFGSNDNNENNRHY
ncbi:hypothetical protein RclHR1_00940013 [Rhizophagus clarus]|uniref:Myb-like domain-containing protein n=1 Tax=Rhizophagus clarus TaxID=94130 RepID=A0A2Z6SIG4_9GLOM|nr:hypothetical protein RclHR1_00940013 [Rhizophagus clarus]GET00636.1 hypothetical protein GLOIN_2v1480146 [Rhizophagus clarus]